MCTVPATALTRENTVWTVPPRRSTAVQTMLPSSPGRHVWGAELYCMMTFTFEEELDRSAFRSGEILESFALAVAAPKIIKIVRTLMRVRGVLGW